MDKSQIPVPRSSKPEIEAGVVGRILSYRDSFAKIADQIHPDLFTDVMNRRVCEAIMQIRQEGHYPDMMNVGEYIAKRYGMEKGPLMVQLMDIAEAGHSTYDIERAVLILRENHIRNRLFQLGHLLTLEVNTDSLELLEKATREITDIQAGAVGDSARHISVVAEETVKEMEQAVAARQKNETPENAVPTGFSDLDGMFAGGWRAGELVILAGRPAMGKTAEALNIAANVATGKPVLFFSLEMRDTELVNRVICSHKEINGMRVRSGELEGNEIMSYAEGADYSGALNMTIDQRSNKLSQIMGISQRWRLNNPKGAGLIVVDYLQLIDSEVKGKSTNDQVGAITRALKLIAMDLKCVVVALSQLNRSVESTSDKRPGLAHLRDSGNIEQDADAVVFVYRPEYYGIETDDEGNSTTGLCENIIAKNRHGVTGVADLQFIAKYGKFTNWGESLKTVGGFLATLDNETAPF